MHAYIPMHLRVLPTFVINLPTYIYFPRHHGQATPRNKQHGAVPTHFFGLLNLFIYISTTILRRHTLTIDPQTFLGTLQPT
jgi:hypothetical protein